jgi:hypothetical protein
MVSKGKKYVRLIVDRPRGLDTVLQLALVACTLDNGKETNVLPKSAYCTREMKEAAHNEAGAETENRPTLRVTLYSNIMNSLELDKSKHISLHYVTCLGSASRKGISSDS